MGAVRGAAPPSSTLRVCHETPVSPIVRPLSSADKQVPYPVPKRIVDKLVCGALLLLLTPFVVLVLVAVAVDVLFARRDRGSVLYREPRVSRGRTFELLKFRTLRTDALAEMRRTGGHARLYEADAANLTWAGRRVLKPWYLDEVPQLLNVLRGDISLVGPRPWPPEMVERQVAQGQDYRQHVMAGLTGAAQVTKGGGVPYADLDREYVERCRTLRSWALVRYDLELLVRTVGVIARGEGLNY
jgi:lipopolysaccharide/colanic/teichoic acid biosynthesis glycosyltransferase